MNRKHPISGRATMLAAACAMMSLAQGCSSGTERHVPVTIASGHDFSGLAVDATHVYVSTDEDVYRIPTQTSGPPERIADAQWRINDLAIDGGAVYWSRAGSGGANVVRWEKTGASASQIIAHDTDVWDLAVTSDSIYWTAPDAVRFAPIVGGEPTTAAFGRSSPLGIAADASSVYWCELGPLDMDREGGSVNAFSFQPSTALAAPLALAPAQNRAQEIAFDDEYVYFTTAGTLGAGLRDGAVKKMKKSGGPLLVIAENQAYPYAIAVDGTHVYWTTLGEVSTPSLGRPRGAIVRAAKAGGGADVIATEQQRPTRIALDASNVYWVNRGTHRPDDSPNDDGAVMKMAK